MNINTPNITAIVVGTILALAAVFWAGSISGSTVEVRTKTVTKTVPDPVEHCITGTLRKYGTTSSTIDECMNLNEAQRSEASEIAESFVDALFAETYEG